MLVNHEIKQRQNNPGLYKDQPLLQNRSDSSLWTSPLESICYIPDAKSHETEILALFTTQASELKVKLYHNESGNTQPAPLPEQQEVPDMYAKLAEYTEPSPSFYEVISTGLNSVKEGMLSTLASVSCIFRPGSLDKDYQLLTPETSVRENNDLKCE